MGFLGVAMSVNAQKVFSVDYASQADVKVFVVDYMSQADLCVYRVNYASQATGNSGAWFWVDYESQADKKIFFVDYESQADLKIYFVEYSSQSEWKNRSKMHLMYCAFRLDDRFIANCLPRRASRPRMHRQSRHSGKIVRTVPCLRSSEFEKPLLVDGRFPSGWKIGAQ